MERNGETAMPTDPSPFFFLSFYEGSKLGSFDLQRFTFIFDLNDAASCKTKPFSLYKEIHSASRIIEHCLSAWLYYLSPYDAAGGGNNESPTLIHLCIISADGSLDSLDEER